MENLVRPPAAGGQIDEGNKIRQYWHVVLERRWLIVTTFAVVVILGAVYAFRATPIYETVARLQIDPEGAGVLSVKEVVGLNNRDQDYLQTQYRNLMSRSLLEKVMQKLKLEEDERYKRELDKVNAVSEDISIAPIRLTRLVEVKVQHPDQKLARDVANTLLDIFLQENKDRKTFKALEGYRLLKQEQQTQEIELQQAIQDLQNYRVKQGSVSLEADANIINRGLLQAKEAYEAQRILSDGSIKRAQEVQRWR